MILVFEHFRATMLLLARTPAYSVITVFLPAVIFLFIGPTVADDRQGANLVMASFAVFAALGIAFFQFGVGTANQRESPWERFARVLPVAPITRFVATTMAATVFAVIAVGLVIVAGLVLTDAAMPLTSWGRLFVAVVAGAVPMAMFGVAIGYWSPVSAALPVANILYLVLSFGGGLFLRPEAMPDVIDTVSRLLPTRHIGELAWASVLGLSWPVESWLWLAGYSVAFGIMAVVGYRRDEGARYR